MKRLSILLSAFGAGLTAQTFTPQNPAALAARQWREQHENAIAAGFVTLREQGCCVVGREPGEVMAALLTM